MVNWYRVKRRLGLFFCGQIGLISGAALTAWEPFVGVPLALIGVLFHVELLLDLYSPREPDSGVDTA